MYKQLDNVKGTSGQTILIGQTYMEQRIRLWEELRLGSASMQKQIARLDKYTFIYQSLPTSAI